MLGDCWEAKLMQLSSEVWKIYDNISWSPTYSSEDSALQRHKGTRMYNTVVMGAKNEYLCVSKVQTKCTLLKC